VVKTVLVLLAPGTDARIRSRIVVLVVMALVSACGRAGGSGMAARESFIVLVMTTVAFMSLAEVLHGT